MEIYFEKLNTVPPLNCGKVFLKNTILIKT